MSQEIDLFRKIDKKQEFLRSILLKKTVKNHPSNNEVFSYLLEHFNRVASISNFNILKLRKDISILEKYYAREQEKKRLLLEDIKTKKDNIYNNYRNSLHKINDISRLQRNIKNKFYTLSKHNHKGGYRSKKKMIGGDVHEDFAFIKDTFDSMLIKTKSIDYHYVDKYSNYINIFNKWLLENLKLEKKLMKQKRNLQEDIQLLIIENNGHYKKMEDIIKVLDKEEKEKIEELLKHKVYNKVVKDRDYIKDAVNGKIDIEIPKEEEISKEEETEEDEEIEDEASPKEESSEGDEETEEDETKENEASPEEEETEEDEASPKEEDEEIEGDKITFDVGHLPRVGLENFSIICYMNSPIQCLFRTIPLTEYFLSNNFKKRENDLCDTWYNLIYKMYNCSYNYISYENIKPLYNKIVELKWFNDGRQSDTGEFITKLIDHFKGNLRNIPNIFDGFSTVFTYQKNNTQNASGPNIEPFNIIQLPIVGSSLHTSLYDYVKKEYIYDWRSPNGDVVLGVKKMTINHCPQILIINLMRDKFENRRPSKINDDITCPLKLDLKPYSDEKENTKYTLYAFIQHKGKDLTHGHYVAYCLDKSDDQWYKYNDYIVSDCTNIDNELNQASILFYSKINAEDETSSTVEKTSTVEETSSTVEETSSTVEETSSTVEDNGIEDNDSTVDETSSTIPNILSMTFTFIYNNNTSKEIQVQNFSLEDMNKHLINIQYNNQDINKIDDIIELIKEKTEYKDKEAFFNHLQQVEILLNALIDNGKKILVPRDNYFHEMGTGIGWGDIHRNNNALIPIYHLYIILITIIFLNLQKKKKDDNIIFGMIPNSNDGLDNRIICWGANPDNYLDNTLNTYEIWGGGQVNALIKIKNYKYMLGIITMINRSPIIEKMHMKYVKNKISIDNHGLHTISYYN